MQKTIMELKNIGKTFSGVNVLRDISFKLRKGEVHALLGENGAGKSTLIKILSGYHQPDKGGTISIGSKEVTFRNPKDAIDASIHTIYQELTLCPDMTVAENIVIDKQDRFPGFAQKQKAYIQLAQEILNKMEQTDINPRTVVRRLSIAQQQIVEIAKAIASDAKVILMDEPTSSISQKDADVLLDIVRKLRDEGVTIIYISHRIHEIYEIADRVTVLRDGDYIGTLEKNEISDEKIINMMVGRDLENAFPKVNVELGETVLKVKNLSSGNTFSDVSFEVRKGEIFGIGGLVGAKRTEVLEALFGIRKITGGEIELKGQSYKPTNPIQSIKNKIAFITEDRKKTGLVLCLPVLENLSMINAQKKSFAGYLDWKKMSEMAAKEKEATDIRVNSLNQRVSTLSGGNQQKVVLGKWLGFEPDIILFDEPTRGIDIGAKTEIYNIMGKLVKNGTTIIMVSSELPELISIADTIMVMREGKARGILTREEATQERVMQFAAL